MRLCNARTISDIEFVVQAPSLGSGITAWSAHGADCTRDIHRYVGQAYSFYLEVLDIQLNMAKTRWRVVIIKERWHFSRSKADTRLTQTLKIIDGKQDDILGWMRLHRDAVSRACEPEVEET